MLRVLLSLGLLKLAVALNNGAALRPPMGFNLQYDVWGDGGPWTNPISGEAGMNFGGGNNEETVLKAAKYIKQNGMQANGYNTMRIDGAWWRNRNQTESSPGVIYRNSTHYIQPNLRGFPTTNPGNLFPRNIAGLTYVLHEQGFRFGIYAEAGLEACHTGSSFPNSGNNREPCGTYHAVTQTGASGTNTDADYTSNDGISYCSWDVDFVKVDSCTTANRAQAAAMKTVMSEWVTAVNNSYCHSSENRTEGITIYNSGNGCSSKSGGWNIDCATNANMWALHAENDVTTQVPTPLDYHAHFTGETQFQGYTWDRFVALLNGPMTTTGSASTGRISKPGGWAYPGIAMIGLGEFDWPCDYDVDGNNIVRDQFDKGPGGFNTNVNAVPTCDERNRQYSRDMNRAHMSMWAISSSPIFLAARPFQVKNLTTGTTIWRNQINLDIQEIVSDNWAVNINQIFADNFTDPSWYNAGSPIKSQYKTKGTSTHSTQVKTWIKPLQNDLVAFAQLNTGSKPATGVIFDAADIPPQWFGLTTMKNKPCSFGNVWETPRMSTRCGDKKCTPDPAGSSNYPSFDTSRWKWDDVPEDPDNHNYPGGRGPFRPREAKLVWLCCRDSVKEMENGARKCPFEPDFSNTATRTNLYVPPVQP